MKMQYVELAQSFDVPIHVLFAHFSKHENVGKLFASNFVHVKDGTDTKYGVGSIRDIRSLGMPTFQETVTVYEPNSLIEYKITSGITPITEHYGWMRFIALDGYHSRLEYRIQLKGRFPLIGELTQKFMQTLGARYLRRLKL